MKKLLLIVFCTVSCLLVHAQKTETDSTNLEQDTIVEVQKPPLIDFESGIFLELGISIAPTTASYNHASAFGGGISYKAIYGGFLVEEFQGKLYSTLVFPNRFNLQYKHGKVFFGVRAMNTRFVEIDMRLSYGVGDMVWVRESNNENFIRSEYTVVQPELSILATPVNWAKVYACVGYKYMNNLELAKVMNEDFSGLTFGIGIRCGIYRQ